jgi:adenylate cyclase
MKRGNTFAAIVTAIIASAFVMLPAFDRLNGTSLDYLVGLRHATMGSGYTPGASPTVVIAIDEETYRRPPFRNLPKVMWTQQIARVLNAVIDGGAKVVGFDLIFPTSVEKFIRGFDQDFLIALRNASKSEKVVLAKVQHQAKSINPFPGYSYAVGHQKNIRAANAFEDSDGVVRRLPLMFRSQVQSSDGVTSERIDPSLAMELAARRTGERPTFDKSGLVSLAGYIVPTTTTGKNQRTMLVNFDGGTGTIPTYSLADLLACDVAKNTGYFRKHFADKVVLFGAVLDVEDRKLTSKRLATGPEGRNQPERCTLPVMDGLFRTDVIRDTIPGVYVHAAAVNNLLRHDALREPELKIRYLAVLLIALVTAATVMLVSPIFAALATLTGMVVWSGLSVIALQKGVVLPMLLALVAGSMTYVALAGYRFAVADKDKRYLRRSFSLYLPQAVVDKMVHSNVAPTLGGETRELSAFFSDIKDFTKISEGLPPKELVEFLNNYLSVVTRIIESHGGFVDKYIGDAVVGVFGAPLDDPDHARHAVLAALECQTALDCMQQKFGLPDNPEVLTRIGICSGDMLIGNIGSGRRFNYTIMGDAANLASRLEDANKIYGTRVLVGQRCAELCHGSDGADGAIVFREIDRVRVPGRQMPERLFEPVGTDNNIAAGQRERLFRFADGLSDYRERNFYDACKKFETLQDDDPAARVYVKRIRGFFATPLPLEWDGVTDLSKKG